MVRVGDGRVLEEVLNEEDVARDTLDGLDQEVVESQTTLAVFGSLLCGVYVCEEYYYISQRMCRCVCVLCVCKSVLCECVSVHISQCVCVCVCVSWEVG